jgi:hypothetical protein
MAESGLGLLEMSPHMGGNGSVGDWHATLASSSEGWLKGRTSQLDSLTWAPEGHTEEAVRDLAKLSWCLSLSFLPASSGAFP